MKEITIVNCTPHVLMTPKRMYETSDYVARLHCDYESLGEADGMPVLREIRRRVVGLPEPKTRTLYIVSRAVFNVLPDRLDLLAPCGQVKDAGGKVIGNHQFLAHGPSESLQTLSAGKMKVRGVSGLVHRPSSRNPAYTATFRAFSTHLHDTQKGTRDADGWMVNG